MNFSNFDCIDDHENFVQILQKIALYEFVRLYQAPFQNILKRNHFSGFFCCSVYVHAKPMIYITWGFGHWPLNPSSAIISSRCGCSDWVNKLLFYLL